MILDQRFQQSPCQNIPTLVFIILSSQQLKRNILIFHCTTQQAAHISYFLSVDHILTEGRGRASKTRQP